MANSDIIASPARIWVAAVGTALPDETTVAADAAWGGTWVELGKTLNPVSINMAVQKFNLFVEQSIVAVRQLRTQADFMFKTTLAEFTGINFNRAVDGTLVTTAAGAGQKGFDAVTVSAAKSDVSLFAVGIEGIKVLADNSRQPVRIFLPRASITLNGDVSFAKSAAVGIPIEIQALADDSGTAMIVHIINAAATA